jgi:hypothetical protein
MFGGRLVHVRALRSRFLARPRRGSISSALTTLLLALSPLVLWAQEPAPAQQPTFKPEELEQFVAPIALYPDSLLAQVLMASTYPLEVVEAARWAKDNPSVTGEALEDAMVGQKWDPSVKSLVAFPDVIAMMNEKLDWTQKLGDAFLAQQAEVMDAVQRLRAKAKSEGNLKSSKEQTVTTEPAPADATTTTTTIIKVEPADPQVVYVPTYNPTVVYGAWPYPAYPPYYYYPPYYAPGAAFFSFTVGVAVGSALWGNCNWGHGDVDINVNNYNNFNRTDINNDINRGNGDRANAGNTAAGDRAGASNTAAGDRAGASNNAAGNRAGASNTAASGKWQHDSSHRKGVQYRDTASQQKYGKGRDQAAVQSREAFRGHADQGRQQISQGGATRDLAGNSISTQNRPAAGGAGTQPRNTAGAGGGAGTQPRATTGATGGAATRDAGQGGAARAAPTTSSPRSSSSGPEAYRGAGGSGSTTRMESSRGSASRSSAGMSRPSGGGGGGGRRR